MLSERQSGILLHPTSLPGQFGIGSFNEWAYKWIDFLYEARQSVWQVLPLGPTTVGDSPYQSFCSHAGNPNLVGIEPLIEEGMLLESDLDNMPEFDDDKVLYDVVFRWKKQLFMKLSTRFYERNDPIARQDYTEFCRRNAFWLNDYALFMTLKEVHEGKPWYEWPARYRTRDPKALKKIAEDHRYLYETFKIVQWIFFRQWCSLKKYANQRGIRILGDIPIFVAMDSADTWAHPDLFCLDTDLKPTVVAGVPPDYFSATGQLWGNPLYRWERHRRDGYQWWLKRIEQALELYDMVRIDHFRGFAAYWEIPAGSETAQPGKWVPGPGEHFFHTLEQKLGHLPVVAEDLGEITPDVYELRDKFNLPGMLVLQFAFSGPDNKFLPHNHSENFVVYTGTHDNDTTLGWLEEKRNPEEIDFFYRYFDLEPSVRADKAVWMMIRAAMGSVARLAVIPLQDILVLGSEARMNTPSSEFGNWQWRFKPESLTVQIRKRLAEITFLYGRVTSQGEELEEVEASDVS